MTFHGDVAKVPMEGTMPQILLFICPSFCLRKFRKNVLKI